MRAGGSLGVVAASLAAWTWAACATTVVGAEDARPADAPPLWTNTPVRIDRSKDTRERLTPPVVVQPPPALVFPGTARMVAGAVFAVGPQRYRLHGLATFAPDRLCSNASGHRWACGRRARTILADLVLDRRLLCRRVGGDDTEPVVDCGNPQRSISETLVAAGWAELTPEGAADPRLAAAAAKAKQRGRGVWSPEAPP